MNEFEKFNKLTEILQKEKNVCGLEFVTLKEFPNYGRGLSSLLSRQAGEELFRIPIKYCITDFNIDKNMHLSKIWVKHPELNETPINKFILLFFREIILPSSQFNRIWLSLFPKDLQNYSIAWTDKELKACGPLCPIRKMTIEIQVWIKKTYKTLLPIVKEFGEIFGGENGVKMFDETMVEYLCMMCRSRGVRLPLNKENPQDLSHCFIPIGDFGNHKNGAKSSLQLKYAQERQHVEYGHHNVFISFLKQMSAKEREELFNKKFFEYDEKNECIIVRSQENILSTQQICYEYTAAPNWELLCNFGFAIPYNCYDRVIVSLTFDHDNPKRLQKELQKLNDIGVSQFLQRIPSNDNNNTNKYHLAIALTLNDALPNVLLAANRIKLLSDEQLNKLTLQEIVFMERIIKQKQKEYNETKNDDNNNNNDDFKSLEVLKSLEWIVLHQLKKSLQTLMQPYEDLKPAIESHEVKHEEVYIVYNSIRSILAKSSQLLNDKIQSLSEFHHQNAE